MLIKQSSDIRSSEISDRKTYLNRRQFIQAAGGTAAATALGVIGSDIGLEAATPAPHGRKLENVKPSAFSVDPKVDKPNRWEDITTYNNYYEFGVDKDSPSMSVGKFNPDPWTVTVSGECNKKAAWHMEDILKGQALEDRIYRHRCVERWSMVIPWVGFPLSDFIKKCEPTSKAKLVQFTTLNDGKQMPGLRSDVLRWPYVEGLRMDEAMHPLTILVVGLYGEVLPNQDGAPLGPLAWLVWAALTGNLSANPLSDLTNETGVWTLRFVCITLAVTPLRRISGWNAVIKFRRMTGLFAFFYGTLHFLTYVIADRFAGLDFPDGIVALSTLRNLAKSVGEDIYKRPFITVGFTTWLSMLPLALTSTAASIRRLGGKRWNRLHRLVYFTGVAGVVHY